MGSTKLLTQGGVLMAWAGDCPLLITREKTPECMRSYLARLEVGWHEINTTVDNFTRHVLIVNDDSISELILCEDGSNTVREVQRFALQIMGIQYMLWMSKRGEPFIKRAPDRRVKRMLQCLADLLECGMPNAHTQIREVLSQCDKPLDEIRTSDWSDNMCCMYSHL